MDLTERSNKMITQHQKEIEDKANKAYIEFLKNQNLNTEPKVTKHFEIDEILKDSLPVGNYQIGVKL